MRFDAVFFLESLFQEPVSGAAVPRPLADLDVGITPDDLRGRWRFEYEERIALMQPDENRPLERIEAAAFADTLRRMREAGIDLGQLRK